MSNKHRLVVNMYDRLSDSGDKFHFSFMLEPKSTRNRKDECAWVFESTNSFPQGQQPGMYEYVPWRYSRRPVNPTKSRLLVAKILVAKLHADRTIDEWADVIDGVLRNVPIVQQDSSFNCRFWTRQGMIALANEGGDFSSIPVLFDLGTGRLEREIIELGIEAHKEYVKKGIEMTPLESDFRKRIDSAL